MIQQLGGSHLATVTILTLWAVCVCGTNIAKAQTPPANDNFVNAVLLTGTAATAEGTNFRATAEETEPWHGPSPAWVSVWYRWQAPSSGSLIVTITNLTGGFGNRFALYEGTELSSLTPLGALASYQHRSVTNIVAAGTVYQVAVDVMDFESALKFFRIELELRTLELLHPQPDDLLTAPGTIPLVVTNHANTPALTSVVYLVNDVPVVVETAPPFTGTFAITEPGYFSVRAVATNSLGETLRTLETSVLARPVNDAFVGALVLPPVDVHQEGTGGSYWATAETGEPVHAGTTPSRSLWWSWTPAYSGEATWELFNVPFHAALAVYTGSSLAELSPVAGETFYSPGSLAWTVEADTTYRLVIDGDFGLFPGAFNWRLDLQTLQLTLPPSDRQSTEEDTIHFTGTYLEPDRPLTSVAYWINGEMVGTATAPDYEFAWQPPAPGVYEVEIVGTNSIGEERRSAVRELTIGPANDHFGFASWIPSDLNNIAWTAGDISHASQEPGEPPHGEGIGAGSVWFRWISPYTGRVHFTWWGTTSSPHLRVYTGGAVDQLTAVDGGDYSTAFPSIPVVAGQEYKIAVDAWPGGEGSFALGIIPPPANNHFAAASVLSGLVGNVTGTILSADFEPGEPPSADAFNGSVWWAWQAPATGDLQIDAGASSSSHLHLGVYRGEDVANLQTVLADRFIALKGSSSGTWESTRIRVHAGRTYHLRFSGRPHEAWDLASAGVVGFGFDFIAVEGIPANDNFADRLLLNGLAETISGDTTVASAEPDEPVPPDSGTWSRQTVWYEYEAPVSGVLTLAPMGPQLKHVVGVWRGAALEDLEWIGYSSPFPPFVQLHMTAGERLILMVDGINWNTGPFQFWYELTVSPANDNFANAAVLTGESATDAGSILAASGETGEPLPTGDSAPRTVWWRWTAPAAGRLTLHAHNWGLGVYQGDALDQLNPIAQDYFQVSTHVDAGEEYFLQLAERPGATPEDYELNLTFTAYLPTDNDDFANAKRIWGTDGGAERIGSLVDATFELGEPTSHTAGNDKSIWWVWQAPQSSTYSFLARYNTVANLTYTVYRGSELSNLVPVAQGTDGVGFNAVGGEDYYLAVAAPSGVEGEVVIENYRQGLPPAARPVPGNLVVNGNFESSPEPQAGWNTSGVLNPVTQFGRAAEGANAMELTSGDIWQDLTTVVGRRYRLKYAAFGDIAGTAMGVSARIDGTEIGRVENGSRFWVWGNFEFVAASTTTRLHLQSLANRNFVDVISVTWINEPPKIVNQPVPRSVQVGGSVLFQVGVTGAPPLSYQWYHDNEPVSNGAERVLALDNVSPAHAGQYHVVVSNEFGTDTSDPAELAVEASDDPLILLQPESRQVPSGATATFSVVAESPRPMTYQWYFNETTLDGQTQRYLILTEVAARHAGHYHVLVDDGRQSVRSRDAVLHLTATSGKRALVAFNNLVPIHGINAPVYDVDGTTRLDGTSFRAQLYAGDTADNMQPVGVSTPLQSAALAGYFNGGAIVIPSLDEQNRAHLQVRAWDTGQGISYEEARARGGRFGASPVLLMTLTPLPEFGPPVPEAMSGIESFALQAGRPLFTTGRIEFHQWIGPGMPEWRLTGEAGFTYSIERREPGNYWIPFLLLENPTGEVNFTDAGATGLNVRFYRSRIVD
jgi:hypothetical protein